MINQFSKNKLIFILLINRFFLASKVGKKLIFEYKKDIVRGRIEFEKVIQKLGFNYNSPENKYLSKLYLTASSFRNNKRIIKTTIENFFNIPLILTLIIAPTFTPLYLLEIKYQFHLIFANYFLSIVYSVIIGLSIISILQFIKNFEIKLGKVITRMMQLLVISSIYCSLYFFIDFDNSIFKNSIFTTFTIIYVFTLLSFLSYLFSEFLIDGLFFSKKIQITEALIITSAYNLSQVDWNLTVQRKSMKQISLLEIERLALLIENDWSNHFHPGDDKTNEWKIISLTSIANHIRSQKCNLILPSSTTALDLKNKFEFIFEKMVKNDLISILQMESAEKRLSKFPKIYILQGVIVAFLPISLFISIKYYAPKFIPTEYLHIAITISALWLILSILLWLDPNLAAKIDTIKSVKSIFKEGKDD